jgi:small subunit ribosomal protein S3Ae
MAQEQVLKTKKKQWYDIVAPKTFGNSVIGHTLVYEPGAMVGKAMSVSLMALTNDIKRQNINIHFEIVSVEDNRGITRVVGYQIVPSSLKRLVRRNSEKMDLSFVCDTADNVKVRIKPLVISRADVKGSIAAKMRNYTIQHVTKAVKKVSFDDLMAELIAHKMQSELRAILSKVYPLKVCEIRFCGIEKEKAKQAEE